MLRPSSGFGSAYKRARQSSLPEQPEEQTKQPVQHLSSQLEQPIQQYTQLIEQPTQPTRHFGQFAKQPSTLTEQQSVQSIKQPLNPARQLEQLARQPLQFPGQFEQPKRLNFQGIHLDQPEKQLIGQFEEPKQLLNLQHVQLEQPAHQLIEQQSKPQLSLQDVQLEQPKQHHNLQNVQLVQHEKQSEQFEQLKQDFSSHLEQPDKANEQHVQLIVQPNQVNEQRRECVIIKSKDFFNVPIQPLLSEQPLNDEQPKVIFIKQINSETIPFISSGTDCIKLEHAMFSETATHVIDTSQFNDDTYERDPQFKNESIKKDENDTTIEVFEIPSNDKPSSEANNVILFALKPNESEESSKSQLGLELESDITRESNILGGKNMKDLQYFLSLLNESKPQKTNQKYPSSFVNDVCFSRKSQILCTMCNNVHRKGVCNKVLDCYRCMTRSVPKTRFVDHIRSHGVAAPGNECDQYNKSLRLDVKLNPSCYICNEKFLLLQDLFKHVKNVHKLCRICGYNPHVNYNGDTTKGTIHMTNHEKCFTHFYRCNLCNNEFSSPNYMYEHHKYEHGMLLPLSYTKYERDSGLECPYCHFTCKHLGVLKFHLQLHNQINCKFCNALFLPSSYCIFNDQFKTCQRCEPNQFLSLHTDTLTIKNNPCLHCKDIYPDCLSLFMHLQENNFCSVCFSFVKSDMISHNKRFHSECYECNICDSTFLIKQSEETDRHHAEHNLESILFRIQGPNMKIEKLLTNKQCPYCLQIVRCRPVLLEHLQQHGIIKCQDCNGAFVRKLEKCTNCSGVIKQ